MDRLLMDDYTPGGVVAQGLGALEELLGGPPSLMLDPSAGSGIFGQVIQQIWPDTHTEAIEPKRGEAFYLSCNYDEYTIGTFEDHRCGEAYDLVATNPPFHSWKTFLEKAIQLVRPGGIVAFLGLTSWGSRSSAGYDLFERITPILQMRIPGAVSYRVRGTDSRDYCWWVFRAEGQTPGRLVDVKCWASMNLARLPSDRRRWSGGKKPGRVYGQEFQTSAARGVLQALR